MSERCPLDDVLDLLRVRGALMARIRAHASWGLRIPSASGAMFHAVSAGACWVRLPGHPPRELFAGDVILLPTGAAHVVSSEVSGPARAFDRVAKARALNDAGELVLDGSGRSTHITCAAYTYDREVAHPLLSLLPPALFVSGQETPEDGAVQTTLRLLRHEIAARSSGHGTVIDRLIDVLFVHVVRTWIIGHHDDETSWLSALRDPTIAHALSVLHARPAAPWSLDALAREVNLSRATLTRRFTALVGEPPLSYLARWRMDLAARDLRETTDAVSAIAHRVGYESEFAFSRAFSRARGCPPGRYRAERRQTTRATR